MKFTFCSLGALNHAELEVNNLTLVCGKNNIGKTYLTYALYGFLSSWKNLLDVKLSAGDYAILRETGRVEIDLDKQYLKRAKEYLKAATESYKDKLPFFLAAQEGRFDNTLIKCDVNIPKDIFQTEFVEDFKSDSGNRVISFKKKKGSSILEVSSVVANNLKSSSIPKGLIENTIKELVWGQLFLKPFIVSTERTGAVTFRSELNLAKNRLIEYAHQLKAGDNYSPMGLIKSVFDTGYPLPVSDNVDFINGLNKIEKRKGQIASEHPDIIKNLAEIVGGVYKTTKEGDVNFVTSRGKQKLRMSESSSAVRSLVMLSYYINYQANLGDLLIIDEPELNLHPSNQRKLARVIVQLVNVGVKVFITTHSDYFIKEFNTLIMLNNDCEGVSKIKKEFGYKDNEVLKASDVTLYTIRENEMYLPEGYLRSIRGTILTKENISPIYGIEARSFDEEINQMNEIQDRIYYLVSE